MNLDDLMDDELVECPSCGEDIPLDAEKCPKCGEDFSEGFDDEVEVPVKSRTAKVKTGLKKAKKDGMEKPKKEKREKIKKEKELDIKPEDMKVKYTFLIIGIILCIAGLIGVVGLRVGFVQAMLGDASPYPGIGNVEPTGHIVSILPFVGGLVTIFMWGIKNEPYYVEKDKLAEEEFSFEKDEPAVEERPAEIKKPEPGPVVAKPISRPVARPAPVKKPAKATEPVKKEAIRPVISKPVAIEKEVEELDDMFDEIDSEITVPDEPEAALDDLGETLAEDDRIEECNEILANADVYDSARVGLMKQIKMGASVENFRKMVDMAVKAKKKREAEMKKQYKEMSTDEIGESLEDELALELASLEDELEEDEEEEEEEDLEEMILKEIEDLEDL